MMERDNRKSHLAPQLSPATQELLRSTHAPGSGIEGARILTFNHLGHVLTADNQLGLDGNELLPQGVALADDVICTGQALEKLDDLRLFSRALSTPASS